MTNTYLLNTVRDLNVLPAETRLRLKSTSTRYDCQR